MYLFLLIVGAIASVMSIVLTMTYDVRNPRLQVVIILAFISIVIFAIGLLGTLVN